jgi:hypothetical protein
MKIKPKRGGPTREASIRTEMKLHELDQENRMGWKTIIVSMMLAILLSVAGCAALTDPTTENNWQAASPQI